MHQPPEYVSTEHPNHVCRLLKSIYGLKQSPRQWYQRFHQCMIDSGYIRFQSDRNVYSRHTQAMFLLLAIYVDDILLLSNSEQALQQAKDELHFNFSMSVMGKLHFCLGIQVSQSLTQDLIKISQQSYIISLLKKYDMSLCKGVTTPLPANLKLQKPDQGADSTENSTIAGDVQSYPYANFLGGIRFLVTCTRPNICCSQPLI